MKVILEEQELVYRRCLRAEKLHSPIQDRQIGGHQIAETENLGPRLPRTNRVSLQTERQFSIQSLCASSFFITHDMKFIL